MKPIYVTKSDLPPIEEYIEKIKPLWDSCLLTNMGMYHNELEKQLKEVLDVRHLNLVSSGHIGIELALNALDIKGEVITTPFTFSSTIHALTRNNIRPVFADIKADDYTLNPDSIEALITDETTAIMPVHVFGHVCDVEGIQAIADKHNLKVIYDAAPGFGITYKGKSLCSYGDISVLSFHATKIFSTIEGGAVICKDPEVSERLQYMRNFGIGDEVTVKYIGVNAKMNELEAAMGLCNLKYIANKLEKRQEVYEWYKDILGDVSEVIIHNLKENIDYNYSYFPIVVNNDLIGDSREEIYGQLRDQEIYVRKYYSPLANEYDCYKGIYNVNTPTAEWVSKNILVLPLYPELTREEVERICNELKNVIRKFS